MAETVTLDSFATLQNSSIVATLNSNNGILETALADCLSLSGTAPNSMLSNLDMNSFQILNLPAPATINSPLRVTDVATANGFTASAFGLLAGNNIWTGLNQFTSLPFVQANSYTGGAVNILSVRGTSGSPTTDGKATAVFQSRVANTTGSGHTIYASLNKYSTTIGIDNSCIWAEAVDNAGGGSISGGRFTASLLVGTGGNGTGCTNVGLANVSFSFAIGAENQCWIVGTAQEATTTFSTSSFAAGVLSSCAGTKSADAGFLVNPLGYIAGHAYITGFMVPTTGAGAGNDPVRDTAFRCDASCVYGMDLSRGTYSGAPVAAPLQTPASSSATGKTGSICWDTGFVYVCTSTNTWKRAALSSF